MNEIKISDSQVENRILETRERDMQIALLQPERLVKLKDLHGSDYESQSCDYIQVKVIWRSEFPPSGHGGTKRCNFILADNTEHISAVMFVNASNINHKNAYKLMKTGSMILKIKNFEVKKENSNANLRIIKYQTNFLKLTGFPRDLTKVDDNEMPSIDRADYFEHFPIQQFTALDKVDNCDKDSFVDVIGYVKDISAVFRSQNNVMYQKVLLSTCSRDFSEKADDEEFEKYAALFGSNIGKIERIDTVYALLNVKVDVFNYENSTSLKTTWCTIELVITKENMKSLLPPNSLTLQQERNLFLACDEARLEFPQPILPNSNGAGSSRRSLPSTNEPAPCKKPKLELELRKDNLPLKQDEISDHDSDEEFPEIIHDFEREFKPLEVKVIPAKKFTGDRKKAYTMRSERRGIALIINNYYFPKREKYIREGSHLDVFYLLQFLKSCKFEVVIKDNVESKNLANVIADFKGKGESGMDACFVAVLSHGVQGAITMVDEIPSLLYNDIIYEFDDRSFPIFKGKPKIFVIQACQTLPAEAVMAPISMKDVELDDTIVCFATIPEIVAQRDIFLGSHYVYVLVHALMNHAHNRDFISILGEVHKRLKKIKKDKTSTSLNCSFGNFGLTKKIYFNPGV